MSESNLPPLQENDIPERLMGAAARIAGNPLRIDAIDKAFEAAGGMLSDYVFNSSESAQKSIRDLVSAGIVDPDNPCAVALCEYQAGDTEKDRSSSLAVGIMKAASSREVAVEASALSRRLKLNMFDDRQAARRFEILSIKALRDGDIESTGIAARGFAQRVMSGMEARFRDVPGKSIEME